MTDQLARKEVDGQSTDMSHQVEMKETLRAKRLSSLEDGSSPGLAAWQQLRATAKLARGQTSGLPKPSDAIEDPPSGPAAHSRR